MADRHLAQLNVARLAHDLAHPALLPFVLNLEPVNAVADASQGFVWRLEDDDTGNATDLRPWGDDMIVNLSVWTDVELLRAYVYGDAHAAVLRQRRAFFTPMDTPSLVLWWIDAGSTPSLEEARDRLEHLAAHGPTPHAFTLREPFPPDSDGS